MKILKLIITIGIFFIYSLSFAWKWYDLWWGIIWSVNSGETNCPTWKILLDSLKNKNIAEDLNVYIRDNNNENICYIPDNNWPIVSSTWYIDNKYINENVVINVSISDIWSWLGSVFYYVNWDRYNWSNSFNINLTEEWWYSIQIYAYDIATIDSYEWTETIGNLTIKTINIWIDKSEPEFTFWESLTWWINSKPEINYKIKDLYKWSNIIVKDFICSGIVDNANYIYPVINSWSTYKVTWTCKPYLNLANCSNDDNYTPNNNSCNWECIEWYIKIWNSCVLQRLSYNCNSWSTNLPDYVFKYNKDNEIEDDWSSEWFINWSSPSWVWINWEFIWIYDSNTEWYSPNLNSCNYSCNNGYHYENTRCINDIKTRCCSELLLSQSTLWTTIDCTLSENQSSVECTQSSICWWKKEVLWEWDYNNIQWKYITTTDWIKQWESGFAEHCSQTIIQNSNWSTCNSRYYLIWNNSITYSCESVAIWEYSSQENTKYICTNWPNNSIYTSNSDSNNCEWQCNDWYTWSTCEIEVNS